LVFGANGHPTFVLHFCQGQAVVFAGVKIDGKILDFCRSMARGAKMSGNRCGLAVRFILKVAEESEEEG
jgi:hypothetical protein